MNVILNICPRDFRMNQLMILLLAMVAVATAMPPMWCGRVILTTDKRHEGNVTGELTLIEPKSGGPVRVQGTIRGLTPGSHGFHVHEKGDLSDGCTSTGAHFNPTKMDHGGPNDSERHVGDLGNIVANEDGVATVDIKDSVISLHGSQSILGLAIVVHAKEDNLGFGHDEASRTTGDSGSRVACGVIGLLN